MLCDSDSEPGPAFLPGSSRPWPLRTRHGVADATTAGVTSSEGSKNPQGDSPPCRYPSGSTPCGTGRMPGYGLSVAAHTANLQPQEVPNSAISDPSFRTLVPGGDQRAKHRRNRCPLFPAQVLPNLQLECNRKLVIFCFRVGRRAEFRLLPAKPSRRILSRDPVRGSGQLPLQHRSQARDCLGSRLRERGACVD